LQNYLLNKGVQSQIHYPVSIHKQEAYNQFRHVYLPGAEKLQKEVLSIPMYPTLTEIEIKKIIDVLNMWDE